MLLKYFLQNFSITIKSITYSYQLNCFDSCPFRLDIVRLKERVFDDPGAPTIINGVFVTVQIIVAKRFSFRASVFAIPIGKLSSLV